MKDFIQTAKSYPQSQSEVIANLRWELHSREQRIKVFEQMTATFAREIDRQRREIERLKNFQAKQTTRKQISNSAKMRRIA